jgi:hypothetical protein
MNHSVARALAHPSGWLLLSLVACNSRPPVSPEPPPGLEEAVMAQAQSMGPHELVAPIQKGATHDEDESLIANVNLEMGQCYVFSVVGDPYVEEVKLYLFNASGQRVLTQENPNRLVASFCVTGQVIVQGWGWGTTVGQASPGIYKVEVKTTEGYGHVHTGIFVKREAPPTPPAPPSAPASDA